MDSPFRLLVTVIVATAILYILLGLFAQEDEGVYEKMKNSLNYAEATEGKLYHTELIFRKDSVFRAELLDSPTRSVRFQCYSAGYCSSEKIIIEPRIMQLRDNLPSNVYFRCRREQILNDCVIYAGGEPAQLEIPYIGLNGKIGRGESASLTFVIENTGAIDAVDAVYEVKIYIREKTDAGEKLILRQNFEDNIALLASGESKTILRQFSFDAPGRYVAKIIAQGDSVGKAHAEQEFEVQEGINARCKAAEKGRTTLVNGECETQYACEGCQHGFECSTRWREKGITDAEIGSESHIILKTSPVSGECEGITGADESG